LQAPVDGKMATKRRVFNQTKLNLTRSTSITQNVHTRGMFNYGSQKPSLLQFEMGAHQHSLHGEDSYFIHDGAFGVADGVGGWNGVKGGNPAEFSRRVMTNCQSELEEIVNSPAGDGNAYLNARDLLVRAAMPVMEDQELLGGSTALIAMLINNNILSVANVGDSRFYLFRRFPDRNLPVLYFLSPEQRFSFNAPIQLSPIQYLDTNSLAVHPGLWSEYYEIPIANGDIVMLVTDGVSDNLFPQEMNQIVADMYRTHHHNVKDFSRNLSKAIVEGAVGKQGSDQSTPFGTPKPDDTTCVVGVVADE